MADEDRCRKVDATSMWRSVDALLGRGRVPPLDDIGAAQFHRYFDDKVAGVRSAMADTPPPSFTSISADVSFCQFQSVTVDEVTAAVRDVHCRPDFVDPGSWSLPTSLRRRHTDIWFLSSVCVTGAAEHHHQLCR